MNLLLEKLARRKHLTRRQARLLMERVLGGHTGDIELGGLLMALRTKGETPDELIGFAAAMRAAALQIRPQARPLIDTCGTGGDGLHTFNFSTAAAIVAAAGGARVAKHGNRAMSSRCGSADILEAAGVRIDQEPAAATRTLEQVGIAFLFAPHYHPALKRAAAVRRELKVRTVFNLLGPLLNPAGARRQVVGVFAAGWVLPLARTLKALKAQRALVVCGEDGIDEISPSGPTRAAILSGGRIRRGRIDPRRLGVRTRPLRQLRGGDPEQNAAALLELLQGRSSSYRDGVLLNAAAALWVAGLVRNLRDGVERAAELIDSGAALDKLERWRKHSAM
ncbi:MAG TPA: anthranilate phosphoribosyltransferase [Acidobacteriota bacterium]